MSQEESPRKESIYQFIADYIQEQGFSPTLREIATACGKISLSTVTSYLDQLEAEGRLLRAWYKSRSIRLQQGERDADELTQAVYEEIVEIMRHEGIAPTLRELAEACHLSKSSVQAHLNRLEAQGKIWRGEGHRSIQLRGEH